MQNNLVIVESPAKAKTIQKFLGNDFKVLSSYGHIRDLNKKHAGIDVENDFAPNYEVPADKKNIVAELKREAKKADMVWLASDEDREGEAISWHLSEVLKLKPEQTKRIVFHEITKSAILGAINNPREIDLNLVDAQQARRILDRLVGFELSPVLWKKVKPSLSAGRVQSVSVRLIVEREREIRAFKPEANYRVVAIFKVPEDNEQTVEMKAELNKRIPTYEEAKRLLESCASKLFKIDEIKKSPLKKNPAPPFTTSTLQQEAARKLGFPVARTMMVAQKLYESGKITYMRTDSVNLSGLAINASKETILEKMGEKYIKVRKFTTKSKGAQEAHEAIRPTDIHTTSVSGSAQEKKLYDLIWKRTIASQMAEAQLEKTNVRISAAGMNEYHFVATGEVIKFDGFLKVYRESFDDNQEEEDSKTQHSDSHMLPPMNVGQELRYSTITTTERFTLQPPRYTEASLVRKLEELGIGRPSTYAPTISTIQNRGYVVRGESEGTERDFKRLVLVENKISEETDTERYGSNKGRLVSTDIGTVVNDFLMAYFPNVMNYNFTADIEQTFDHIATGDKKWTDVLKNFYTKFHPNVEKTLNMKMEHRVGERLLGNDSQTGFPVTVKIGRYGPVVQMGDSDSEDKPRFAQLRKGQSIETLTLEEAHDLFKLPRVAGEYEDLTVKIGVGRFGPYIYHRGKYVSIPKTEDPLEISLDKCIELIEAKRQADKEKHIKSFDEEPDLEILNGRWGPYISYQKSNYKIPKTVEDPKSLSLEDCLALVKKQEKGTAGKKKANARAAATKKKATKKVATKKTKTIKKSTTTKKVTAKSSK